MAHIQQLRFINFIKESIPELFNSKKVLEIGSLNINGSVRQFFSNCDYTGLDVAEGKDVDIVCNGENYYEKADSFDVIAPSPKVGFPARRKPCLNGAAQPTPQPLQGPSEHR